MSAKKGMKGNELCRTLDIQPYVLRYWETEFRALAAPAGASGQRTYSDVDVALVRRIKQLLYEEGYTIAGAKKKLESEPLDSAPRPAAAPLFDAAAAPAEEEAAEEPASDETTPPDAQESARAAAPALDGASSKQIEQLRRGIAEALAEARSLLSRIEKPPR